MEALSAVIQVLFTSRGMVNVLAATSGSRDTRMGTDSVNLVALFLAFSELA
jgi:hypothetical protein